MTKEHVDVWDWRFLKASNESFRKEVERLLGQITRTLPVQTFDCRSIHHHPIERVLGEASEVRSMLVSSSEPSPEEKQRRGTDWKGSHCIVKGGEIVKACYFCGAFCICPVGGYGIVPDSK